MLCNLGATGLQAAETNASAREGCLPRDERSVEQVPGHAATRRYPLLHRKQTRGHQVHWHGILHRHHRYEI